MAELVSILNKNWNRERLKIWLFTINISKKKLEDPETGSGHAFDIK